MYNSGPNSYNKLPRVEQQWKMYSDKISSQNSVSKKATLTQPQ